MLYIRCPDPGEGIFLLLRVLVEFPGDFPGLLQLLRQVCENVLRQLLVSEGKGTEFYKGHGIKEERREMRRESEVQRADVKRMLRM